MGRPLSFVNVFSAGAMKHVGRLANPFVSHPFGAEDDRTASMEHGHVRPAALLHVVPKHGRALAWWHPHPEPGENSPATFGHLQKWTLWRFC